MDPDYSVDIFFDGKNLIGTVVVWSGEIMFHSDFMKDF